MIERLSFDFSSKVDNIRVVRAALRAFLKNRKVPEAEIFDTELALNEAVANVIEHTYQFAESKRISIDFFWVEEENTLEVVIQDFGQKVEMNHLVSRDLEKVDDHGLGVYLIKSIMDNMEFVDVPDEVGNRLRLVKKFSLRMEEP
ncbi:MAG TPA: ATP-binding protein [Thermotogota bacterium]|nr:ATP-binding protein [Thermotogota bacterium]HRW91809.1 ATP-binding protein [Thermotogota bacterium]